MLHPDVHEIELAPIATELDPEVLATTMPFTTWVGRIRVDARGAASILRRTGDEDIVETGGDVATAIEAAFDADSAASDAPQRHLVGTFLPMRALVPMLGHLSDPEAFEICAKMRLPDVEQEPVRAGMAPAAFIVRAARVNGTPGWCAVLPERPR